MCSPFTASSSRFLADGFGLDTTFGSSGTDIFDFDSTDEIANALAIDSSGRIVLAGNSGTSGLLVRLTSSGALDTSFDTDGKITFLPTSGTQAWFNDLAIDAAGRYVLAGTLQTSTNSEMLLMRVNTDASLDTSFDSDGIVRDNAAYNSEAQSLVLQPDGRIVVGGRVDHDTIVVRFDPNGSRDQSFGTSGRVRVAIEAQFGIDIWTSVVSDGKNLYAAGVADYNQTNVFDVAAMRLNTGVSFDQTLYFEQDAKFNVTSVSNSGGEVLERYGYMPYGGRTVYTAGHIVLSGTGYEQNYSSQGTRVSSVTKLLGVREVDVHAFLGVRFLASDTESANSRSFAQKSNPISGTYAASTEWTAVRFAGRPKDVFGEIVSDEKGGFEIDFADPGSPEFLQLQIPCVKEMVTAHEKIHIQDYTRMYPNSALDNVGKPLLKGTPPRRPNDVPKDVWKAFEAASERRAWSDTVSRMVKISVENCQPMCTLIKGKDGQQIFAMVASTFDQDCCKFVERNLSHARRMAATGVYE